MSKNPSSTVLSLASSEARDLLRKPFVRYSDNDAGYNRAVEDHRNLMDFELGSDEHPEVQQALVDRRWALADYYQSLHGWDVQC
jgi:hypothetical protein